MICKFICSYPMLSSLAGRKRPARSRLVWCQDCHRNVARAGPQLVELIEDWHGCHGQISLMKCLVKIHQAVIPCYALTNVRQSKDLCPMPKDMIWKAHTASAYLSYLSSKASWWQCHWHWHHRNRCQDAPRQIEGFSHPTSSHAKATSDPWNFTTNLQIVGARFFWGEQFWKMIQLHLPHRIHGTGFVYLHENHTNQL